ncbi:MAG: hypothetical protein QOH37_67, partial [Nocardioidaceae bacterium]|nr:hypothetical protein [Nocardioidaceae bacterium]
MTAATGGALLGGVDRAALVAALSDTPLDELDPDQLALLGRWLE